MGTQNQHKAHTAGRPRVSVLKSLPCNAGNVGLILGRGTKIPPAVQTKLKNKLIYPWSHDLKTLFIFFFFKDTKTVS